MSFEPVDVTDMVNLLTGDLSYVIPILNVPGPAGGYPLALSYHAGVAMDQEASWLGLGWGINPGSINRNVNGFPDDINGEFITQLVSNQKINYSTISYFTISAWLGESIGAISVAKTKIVFPILRK